MPLKLNQTMTSMAKKMHIDYEDLTKQLEHKELKGRAREILSNTFLRSISLLPSALKALK